MIKRKILIIDNDMRRFNDITMLLMEENFDLTFCTDSSQGITLTRQLKPDLIICDIMNYGIVGYEIFKELRKDDVTSAIPFIFTAEPEKSDFRKEMDADGFMDKSFNNNKLLLEIKTRLSRFEEKQTMFYENNDNGRKYMTGEKILFKLHNSTIIAAVERIKYISANNQYTSVVLDDNRQVIMRRSITKWESILPENLFIRIHRSTIINIEYIEKIENNNNKHNVVLKNTIKSFEISRRYFKRLNFKYNINAINFNRNNLAG